jgi:transcriptional regulator with XRE-family HTH domain
MVIRMGDNETKWPHGPDLRKARGSLSAEKAARAVDVSRGAWDKWERGERVPNAESLRRIVEEFGVPPEAVGYIAPEGWELVPSSWISERFDSLNQKLDQIIKNQERS